jgi:AAA15 family ATPase/GTPase
MLIEFSVTNFRSFRERKTFSMVAAPRLKKGKNTFKPDVIGEKLPDLLKVAAIYGPNASGKSNLLKALQVLQELTKIIPNASPAPLPVKPFRFDVELLSQASRFEIHFIHAQQRYEFEFALTAERIIEERLVAYPKGKEALLYHRKHTSSGDEYIFGEQLEGGESLHDAWAQLTSPHILFISQAVANSNESLLQLRKPFAWMKSGLLGVDEDLQAWAKGVKKMALEFPTLADELPLFLQDVDVPIVDFKVSAKTSPLSSISPELVKLKNLGESQQNQKPIPGKTTLTHSSALGQAQFDFDEESEGTKSLIGFWLPWRMMKDDYFKIVIVDELDSSLHPAIVASLIERHLNSNIDSQLIFTTHDTHLMDAKLLRRDQFWLTERDMNGATQLRSIHDFNGREGEDIEKRYYAGQYRGFPIIHKN